MRFPSIPSVAQAVRILSAASSVEIPVQLLVSKKDGAWECVPGEMRVAGIHDHCWLGVSRVPGQNKQGKPRRFRSEDIARDLLAQARAQATSAPPRAHGRPAKARGTAPPPSHALYEIGALVAFYGVPGRVVGHATLETTGGPIHVHLVEAAMPAFVPAWNLNVTIVPVVSEALAPWVPPTDAPHVTFKTAMNQARVHA